MFTELRWSEFILSILNGPQGNLRYIPRVENSGTFMSAIAELANQKGGKVIIGFDKSNYQLHGVRFEKSWLKAVIEKEITPRLDFDIKLVIHNRKVLYIIDVPEGVTKPYQFSLQQSVPEIKPLPITDEVQKSSRQSTIVNNIELFSSPAENKEPVDNETSSEILSEREKKCLAFIKENTEITNSQYRDLNGVSHKTAHNELSHLVKTGVLRQEGQGRTTKYCLNSEKTTAKELTESVNIEKDNSVAAPAENTSKDNADNIIETDYSYQKIVEPDFQIPSLFGADIDDVIGKINPSVSITDIRKAAQSSHMNSHFNENNDINFAPPSFDPAEEQAIDEELAEDFGKEEQTEIKENTVFEQIDDGDDLLKQLAELYEQIKS